MQVKEIKQDGLSHEMEVIITAQDIDKRIESRLKEVGKDIKLPGFRPGKVPLKILKQKYGRAIMGEVLEQTVNETSQKALQDKDLKPAIQPKIEVKDFDEGKDLIYSLAVEVQPKFEITDFKGIKLEKPVSKPDDKAVEDALKNIAESRGGTAPVKGRGAKEGDTVVIDFHGRTADDNKEHEGMHSHDHHLKLGSGQFIPGFEDQLIGKKSGEKIEVKVTFPENYGAKDLAGRDAIFDVDIKDILEPAEAKIDDEFAKSLGLDDLEALKKAIEGQLISEFETHSRMNLKKALLDYLDEAHDFDIPAGMLDMEFTNIIDQVKLDHQRNNPGSEAELSKDEEAELKEIAERRVRLGLILSEIGRQNNLQVPDTELQKAVIAEAQKYPGQEKEVFEYYSKNQQALESMRAPLFEDKVVDFMIELAEVTEKEVSPEELIAGIDEDAEDKPKKKTTKKKSPAKKETKAKSGTKKAPAKKAAAKKTSSKKKKAS